MNKALMSSNNDDWETPQWLFDALSARHGGFTLDAAARAGNEKCGSYFSADKYDRASSGNGLDPYSWPECGRVFVNPPYGRGMIHWAKAITLASNVCSVIVCVVPARVDTRWWRRLILGSVCPSSRVHVEYIAGRITFELNGKPITDAKGRPCPAPFPTAIVTILGRLAEHSARDLSAHARGSRAGTISR